MIQKRSYFASKGSVGFCGLIAPKMACGDFAATSPVNAGGNSLIREDGWVNFDEEGGLR